MSHAAIFLLKEELQLAYLSVLTQAYLDSSQESCLDVTGKLFQGEMIYCYFQVQLFLHMEKCFEWQIFRVLTVNCAAKS